MEKKMKIHNFIITAFFLAVIFGFGIASLFTGRTVVSVKENRLLAALPVFSISGYLEGSFTRDLEAYYNDHFPLRDSFLDSSRNISSLYYFDAFGHEEVVILPAAQHAAAEAEVTAKTEAAEKPAETPAQPEPEAEKVGQLLIYKSMIMESFVYSQQHTDKYIKAINRLYADCGGIKTYVLTPPCAAELYMPEKNITEANRQGAVMDMIRDNLNGPVFVDLEDTFKAHMDEYIYFKTDHHWTALGAYYAYRGLMTAMDLQPVDIEAYRTGKESGFLGSLYNSALKYPQSKGFENSPDTVEYYYPLNEAEVTDYNNAAMLNGTARSVLEPAYGEGNKYNIFFGGDMRLAYIHSDVGGGESIMVVRDSYGHAFLPFLTDHFEHIYAVEPRYFNKEEQDFVLSEFMAERDIGTLLFVNYSLPASGEYWLDWGELLEKMCIKKE